MRKTEKLNSIDKEIFDKIIIWTLVETTKWMFVVLEKEELSDSFRCAKLEAKNYDRLQFEEVLYDEIRWWTSY